MQKMQKDFQRGEHTESLEKSYDGCAHRSICSCRPDDVSHCPEAMFYSLSVLLL